MVPIKFADLHGNDLNDRIFLKVPSGLVWSVDLERRTNRVWLQNGWPKFANHYSIRGGYMLLFNYLGDSQFEVSIFDSSAVQIDYSLYDIDDSTRTDVIRPRRMTRASSSRQQVQLEEGIISSELLNFMMYTIKTNISISLSLALSRKQKR